MRSVHDIILRYFILPSHFNLVMIPGVRWLTPCARPLNHTANTLAYIMTSNENVTHALIMETGRSHTQASAHGLGSKRDTWLLSPVPRAVRVCVWPLLQLPAAAAELCPSANWATFSQLVQHEPKRTGAAVAWHQARPCLNSVLPARTLASLCACRGILHQQPTHTPTKRAKR